MWATMAARSSAAWGDQRPCILRTKHPFDTLSYLFVREVFAPVELFQPLVDALAKPCVMVEIMLYKLLNIRVSIAAVLGGDAVQLGLQVGAEMYFHSLENRDFQDYCQFDTAWRRSSRTTLAVRWRLQAASNRALTVFLAGPSPVSARFDAVW